MQRSVWLRCWPFSSGSSLHRSPHLLLPHLHLHLLLLRQWRQHRLIWFVVASTAPHSQVVLCFLRCLPAQV